MMYIKHSLRRNLKYYLTGMPIVHRKSKQVQINDARCKRMRMLRYDVPICVDMSNVTANVHVFCNNSETFCRFIAQAKRAYLAIVLSLQEPMAARPVFFS